MLRFAVRIILFISPLLLLIGVVERQANSVPSNYAIKRAKLEQNIESAKVIITGSSHAYYGIKPALLGVPATNIAYVGQGIYYDTRILYKFLSRASSLKLVIVTVSYHSFEYSMQDSIWGARVGFYKKFWDIPHEYPAFKLADYSAIALFGVHQSRDFVLTGTISEPDKIDEEGGNDNLREIDRFAVMNGQIAVKRQEAEMKLKYFAQNAKYLDELFSTLKERNIQAVIVTTPGVQTYYNNLNAERYMRMQNEIQALCQKYGLEYGNYLKDERFDDEDFYDGDHLSTQGAEKFSRILKDEIIEKYVH